MQNGGTPNNVFPLAYLSTLNQTDLHFHDQLVLSHALEGHSRVGSKFAPLGLKQAAMTSYDRAQGIHLELEVFTITTLTYRFPVINTEQHKDNC